MTENTSQRRSIDISTSPIRPVKRRKSCVESKQDKPATRQKRKLPTQYIDCNRIDLITIISRMLSSIVKANDELTVIDVKYLSNENLTRFHSRSPPQISIYNYLLRLAHYSSLENCVLIATVYYIDLLTKMYPSFALNSLTVHRFLLTATTIASKALCDSFCSNQHYAKVGGVNIIELNLLEVEFLEWVNYRVVPRDFNYDKLCERRSSAGGTEINTTQLLKYGISTADKILDLYYEKMIGLVGGVDGDFINVGMNDDVVYQMQELQSSSTVLNLITRTISTGSTSSSISTSISSSSSSTSHEYEDDHQQFNSPSRYNLPVQSAGESTSYSHSIATQSDTIQPNVPIISQQSPSNL